MNSTCGLYHIHPPRQILGHIQGTGAVRLASFMPSHLSVLSRLWEARSLAKRVKRSRHNDHSQSTCNLESVDQKECPDNACQLQSLPAVGTILLQRHKSPSLHIPGAIKYCPTMIASYLCISAHTILTNQQTWDQVGP